MGNQESGDGGGAPGGVAEFISCGCIAGASGRTILRGRSFLSGFWSNLKDLASKSRTFLRGFGSGPSGAKNIPLFPGCTMGWAVLGG